MEKKNLQIIYQNVDALIPYINNPRFNDNAVDKVASSIKNFGFKNPIIVDGNNEIIAGHTRLKAAKKLGIKEVPTIKVEDLTDSQIKAFRIADNKVAEFSQWDFETLESELEMLELDFNMEEFGFEVYTQNESEEFLDINFEDHDAVKSLRFLSFAKKRIPITEEEENELLRVYDEYVEKHGVDIGFAKGLINGL